jgi:hypothetical protein
MPKRVEPKSEIPAITKPAEIVPLDPSSVDE